MAQQLSDYLQKSNAGNDPDDQVYLEDEQDTEEATGVISGERTMSGTTPVPTSDDNVLDSAQDAGLYTEADEENPHELNVAQEIDEAEVAFRDEQPQ
ncbi:MAG TPA: hypothetical protein VF209_04450 [Patescibacteria group bacterium]